MVSTFKKHFADGNTGSRARVLEDYSVLSPIATAIVTATFEVQMARVVREQFGLTPDQLPDSHRN